MKIHAGIFLVHIYMVSPVSCIIHKTQKQLRSYYNQFMIVLIETP